jgi:hypothetical protein
MTKNAMNEYEISVYASKADGGAWLETVSADSPADADTAGRAFAADGYSVIVYSSANGRRTPIATHNVSVPPILRSIMAVADGLR